MTKKSTKARELIERAKKIREASEYKESMEKGLKGQRQNIRNLRERIDLLGDIRKIVKVDRIAAMDPSLERAIEENEQFLNLIEKTIKDKEERAKGLDVIAISEANVYNKVMVGKTKAMWVVQRDLIKKNKELINKVKEEINKEKSPAA